MKYRIIATAILAFVAAGAAGEEEAVTSQATDITLTNAISDREAGKGIAYQCIRDFRQCLKTIPPSTFWSTTAYGIEQDGCCIALSACEIFANDVANATVPYLQSYSDSACPSEESSGVVDAETRRQAHLEGIQASQN